MFDNQPDQLAECTSQLSFGNFNVKTKVQHEITELQEVIERKKELLKLLENNPDFERMLILMKNY